MSDKKYVVPDGMLEAVNGAWDRFGGIGLNNRIKVALEAAIRWQSENPVVPTGEQIRHIFGDYIGKPMTSWSLPSALATWQAFMYLAPEPEVPEAVKDLLLPTDVENGFFKPEIMNERLIRAYYRGKDNK